MTYRLRKERRARRHNDPDSFLNPLAPPPPKRFSLGAAMRWRLLAIVLALAAGWMVLMR